MLELDLYRRAHAGAASRAAASWALIERIRACRLWLPREATLKLIADNVFHSAAYDACERYESAYEFAEDLRGDLDATWAEREIKDGVDMYVLKPFFAKDQAYMGELRIGYFRGCSIEDLTSLNVPPPGPAPAGPVTGLSEDELRAVVASRRSATVHLVNRLRHLETAASYLSRELSDSGRARWRQHVHSYDEVVHDLVAQLAAVAHLPFQPPAAKFFGTDADLTNPLRTLPADADFLAPLLADAPPPASDRRLPRP